MQVHPPNTFAEKGKEKTGEEVYFQGSKKNQILDIKLYFKTIVNVPEHSLIQKEIIKKIISYTTQGIDTSRLYPQMVLASATKDIVEKKLIFFYLSKYSRINADFARMAINTFVKDTSSANPTLRALSLKHLSNLRFKGRQDYVLPFLQKGLTDFSPIVKKASIMGMTKILTERSRHQQSPERNQQILNTFYELIRQSDASVVCTVLQAINEIQPQGIAMSKKLATYLLSNIGIFSEMQLPVILKYIELYEPKSQAQAIDTMNIIQGKMKSASLTVMLGVSKILLKYGKKYNSFNQQIHNRIKLSILSFIGNDLPQIQYVALKHIQYIIENQNSELFVENYKIFFLKSDQPSYLKHLKIMMLVKNCRHNNLGDILTELSQYIQDEQTSKDAFQGLQTLILVNPVNQVKLIAKTILKHLQSSNKDFLFNNALPILRNFLRRCPNQLSLISPIFYKLVEKASNNEARIAIIDIIGEYGEYIEDAIQLLSWSETEIQDQVRISLLRANVKIFLKRPFEMVNVLPSMFKNVLEDQTVGIHVRDYAAYLYRGLQSGSAQFGRLMLSQTKVSEKDNYESTYKKNLQYNSLETIYNKQSQNFLPEANQYIESYQQEYLYDVQGQTKTQQQPQQDIELQNKRRIQNIDLSSRFHQLDADEFDIEFQMDANEYQTCWETYQTGASMTRMIKTMENISAEYLDQLCKIWSINTIAEAEDEKSIKLYLYCKILNGQIACMELQVSKEAETLALLIKSQNQELCGFISRYVQGFLKLNDIL